MLDLLWAENKANYAILFHLNSTRDLKWSQLVFIPKLYIFLYLISYSHAHQLLTVYLFSYYFWLRPLNFSHDWKNLQMTDMLTNRDVTCRYFNVLVFGILFHRNISCISCSPRLTPKVVYILTNKSILQWKHSGINPLYNQDSNFWWNS